MASSSLRPTSPAPPVTPIETITFPDGEQHHVLVRDAHRLVIEFRVDPMEEPNARHVHDCSDEIFEVLGGTLWFELDGVAHTLRAGDHRQVVFRFAIAADVAPDHEPLFGGNPYGAKEPEKKK